MRLYERISQDAKLFSERLCWSEQERKAQRLSSDERRDKHGKSIEVGGQNNLAFTITELKCNEKRSCLPALPRWKNGMNGCTRSKGDRHSDVPSSTTPGFHRTIVI